MCEHNAKALLMLVAILGFLSCLGWVVYTATSESVNSQVTEVNDIDKIGFYRGEDSTVMEAKIIAVNKLVQARKKQAIDKGLFKAGMEVAYYLGSLKTLTGWEYENNDLLVKSLFLDVVITYQGKEVFKTSLGEVESYIPGEWENQLLSLEVPAKRAKAAKEYQDNAKVIDSQKAAFGFSEEDIRAKM